MADDSERLVKYYCSYCGDSFWVTPTYGHDKVGDTHKCFCGSKAKRYGKADWFAERGKA